MEQTLRRAIQHARAAGDRREERQSFARLAVALALGLDAGRGGGRRVPSHLRRQRGRPDRAGNGRRQPRRARGDARAVRGGARACTHDSKELLDRPGKRPFRRQASRSTRGPVELLAGEPEVAERELRAAYELLSGIGERSALSTVAAFLARALLALDRLDESARFTRVAQRTASPDDVLAADDLARNARARRRAPEAAMRARSSSRAPPTRSPVRPTRSAFARPLRSTSRAQLADAGQPGSAEPLLREALELYIEKGDVVGTERMRVRARRVDRP